MTDMSRIVWSSGFGEQRYKGISAVKVYDEILSIGDSATPEQIVEKAQDASTELHKCFTWDDVKAAENWRKQEARLIRHFLVIRNDADENLPEIRAFHFTVSGEGYKAAPIVFKQPNEYTMLLKRAYAELHAFAKKYNCFKNELAGILQLIEQLP